MQLQRAETGDEPLLITPYHPVAFCEERAIGPQAIGPQAIGPQAIGPQAIEPRVWYFPGELDEIIANCPCAAVYSFVLDAVHVMEIGGFDCITLGHGFTEDKAAHPYFGTAAVLADLAQLPGFAQGLVELASGALRRCPVTGLIVGFN